MPNSGLRKYTLNGGLLMLPPPPLAERGLSVSSLINSFCLAVCLSAGIGGKRVLSAALKRLGAAKAASNAIANVFLMSSSLNVIGWPPVRAEPYRPNFRFWPRRRRCFLYGCCREYLPCQDRPRRR